MQGFANEYLTEILRLEEAIRRSDIEDAGDCVRALNKLAQVPANAQYAELLRPYVAVLIESFQDLESGDHVFASDAVIRARAGRDRVYPVWYCTNRKKVEEHWGAERSDTSGYGRALVHIPRSHRFGEINSSAWAKLRRFDFADDTLRIRSLFDLNRSGFLREINDEVDLDGGPHAALIFIHGYNVDFQESLVQAAQLGVDLQVNGPVIAFSWPSFGKVLGYTADEATVQASEPHLYDLISCLAETDIPKIHIIAHSMGNRALLGVLNKLSDQGLSKTELRCGQVILAAADVDRDTFLMQCSCFPGLTDRTTLYASRRDFAVYLSYILHANNRVGLYDPKTVVRNSLDTILVPNFNVDFMGHGYFSRAREVLQDIYSLIRNDSPPQSRFGLNVGETDDGPYWEFGL